MSEIYEIYLLSALYSESFSLQTCCQGSLHHSTSLSLISFVYLYLSLYIQTSCSIIFFKQSMSLSKQSRSSVRQSKSDAPPSEVFHSKDYSLYYK